MDLKKDISKKIRKARLDNCHNQNHGFDNLKTLFYVIFTTNQ